MYLNMCVFVFISYIILFKIVKNVIYRAGLNGLFTNNTGSRWSKIKKEKINKVFFYYNKKTNTICILLIILVYVKM
jgi:hypothetical protein